jgi:ribonuclease-3
MEALTHRSFVNEAPGSGEPDNQRLEFYGDAVLGFVVSGMLYRTFPSCREGDMTRMRASLVHEESLASLATSSGIGFCLRLGRGEEKSGGRTRRSLLADAYEALMAAVYLDGGTDAVTAMIERQFRPLLDGLAPGGQHDDYKSRLQEKAQALKGLLPVYRLKEQQGPAHDRYFVCEVLLGANAVAEGGGRSKKEAEQDAACKALQDLRLWDV